MKKLLVLAVLAFGVLSCKDQITEVHIPDTPADTVLVKQECVDTLYFEVFDTTFVNDTLYFEVFDTTFVEIFDTTFVEVIDTTYVEIIDTLGFFLEFCERRGNSNNWECEYP